jgi:predicted acetyltransferase
VKVELRAASDTDQPIIGNLLQLYLHDFSEFDGNRVDADGLFQYPYLARYWEHPDRHAFLITANGLVAGFALVKKGSELAGDMEAMDLAEFFVLRAWRLKGVGRYAFKSLAVLFPGRWLVRVQDNIPGAAAFWERTIPDVSGGLVEKETVSDGKRDWTIFRFAVPSESGNQ